MATKNSSVARCSKCNFILNEYVKLSCNHKLCRICTRKTKQRDNTIVCFSRKCTRVSQKVPTFRSVVNDMKQIAMEEFKISIKNKEAECMRHVEKLEMSVKELREDEQRQMDFISSMYEKRANELRVHYGRMKKKTTGLFNKRRDQIEKILTGIKDILQKIHDELKKMNDSEALPGGSEQARMLVSQTIEVDIPGIERVVHVDGHLGINDDIEIIAPEPQLRISAPMKDGDDSKRNYQQEDIKMRTQQPEADIPTKENDGDDIGRIDQPSDIKMSTPKPEIVITTKNDGAETRRIHQSDDIKSGNQDQKVDIPTKSDLGNISRRQFVRQEHSVKLPSVPTRLRLIHNNELWQCHFGSITVLDAELRPLREIDRESDIGNMGDVWDVTALPDEDVAVAGENGLFVMDHKGKKRYRIAARYFTGVAEHDGALYAAKYEGSIRVYKQANGWKECRRIDLGCGEQAITISIQDSMVYACLCNDAKLVAYSLSGEQMGSWGRKGRGKAVEFDWRYLCMAGTDGDVLIADESNNRLQVLGADRQWSVVSLQPPVKSPRSALLHRGRLFVASGNNNTLYVYEPSDRDA